MQSILKYGWFALVFVFVSFLISSAPAFGAEQNKKASEEAETATVVEFYVDGKLVNIKEHHLTVGSKIAVKVVVPMDGYGYLISAGPSGKIYQLWPSRVVQENQVKKGESMMVGPFPVTEPSGTERLIIFFSQTELKTDVILHTSGFEKKPEQVREVVTYRGLDIAPDSKGVNFAEEGTISERGMKYTFNPQNLNVILYEFTSYSW